MRLFQIYITDTPVAALPPSLELAFQELQTCFVGAEYSLWNDQALRAFLQQQFEPDVLQAYDNLIPYAYRSDLARYCLLYHFGGW